MILFGTLVLCAGAVVMAAPEAKSWASQLPLPTTRARGCSSDASTQTPQIASPALKRRPVRVFG